MTSQTLDDIAHPKLDDTQIAALDELAARKTFQAGQILFKAGESGFKFFVVRSGEVEIVENTDGERKTLTIHEPGEFTGDVDMLTGRPSIVTAQAKGKCEVYEIAADDLRRILREQSRLGDVILRAFIARRQSLGSSGFVGLRVIGSRFSSDTLRIRDFLARNRQLFTWTDVESDPQTEELLRRFEVHETDTPVVCWTDTLILRNPSNLDLAERIGIRQPVQETVYDLAVIGAGPAGLAAAVYGASEGLNTVVLEAVAPGGQAGTSSKIENYLGFPTGISGEELAGRATLQAHKFGVHLSTPSRVVGLAFEHSFPILRLEGGEHVSAKCVLIATGAEYRKLPAEDRERFDGAGVYYAATAVEAQTCGNEQVVVVGGGNSAGQAAIFLADYASKVLHLIRGSDLSATMSRYLARRIERTGNIELLTHTEINKMSGGERLAVIEIINNQTGETRRIDTSAVFTFIGAIPCTDWLPEQIETDEKGFIKTGVDVSGMPDRRRPFLLETSHPGVFAAGDVRAGSVKRVASAVGEGAMAVQLVHEYLKQT